MASLYIKQICDDIRNRPERWSAVPEQNSLYCGLTDGNIRISQAGLSGRWALTSICELFVGEEPYKIQGNDSNMLDRATLWWYRNQPQDHVLKTPIPA
jgi:hypothetical protein